MFLFIICELQSSRYIPYFDKYCHISPYLDIRHFIGFFLFLFWMQGSTNNVGCVFETGSKFKFYSSHYMSRWFDSKHIIGMFLLLILGGRWGLKVLLQKVYRFQECCYWRSCFHLWIREWFLLAIPKYHRLECHCCKENVMQDRKEAISNWMMEVKLKS